MKKIGSTLLFFTLVWIGCTGVPSGAITEYRLTIGTATMDDFIALSNRTLNRHRYIVDRTEDRGTGAIVECKNEYPGISNEEALQGIIEIKYTLFLEARVKSSGGGMFSVRAIVQSYGRFSGNEDWVDIPINDESKRRVKTLANDLKTEFESKIRAF
ncbi:MAG: hypothetical protein HOA15_01535 [Candidatus Marinimicrobia bacterium]|nr:hypothetical protein [Candidatus Neomarinimicrobiota bacterium]MBT3675444.1 hypothetical protein [Candidatus Neomarinimicrobiota bacterium]MBT6130174.1 hypothetical protein [Candidatus Neomarinimicrobiota bacterium]MBT6416892.1 hypothetical protein [Candidatus Neomarinimicrobiota bacterium]MBT6840578.1 hypothetical protein [Candidatus Neomarinimicrobiota bacterium]